MKLIVAIIQPQRLESVHEALMAEGIIGITVSDVQGFGRQKGHTEVYRGNEYTVNFVRKVKVEVACADGVAEKTAAAICAAAKSSPAAKIGDGKIFVLNLQDAIRVRTGERGADAL